MQSPSLSSWLDSILPKHSSFLDSTRSILRTLLEYNKIDYLSITGRVKTKESILEKIKRKSYTNPESQLTDISGIRIVTFSQSDVEKISNLIKTSFDIDINNSLDKSQLLGVDKIGYRSVHFVCNFGQVRLALPEFIPYIGLCFELQIRTVLQHAWAELAHDRNYKFTGVMPDSIQRKLNLYAGLLEIADAGLNEIAKEFDEYVSNITQKTAQGDFDININTPSFLNFMQVLCENLGLNLSNPKNIEFTTVLTELKDFGISKIKDLSDILTSDYISFHKKSKYDTNYIGFVRDAMMFNDIDKYFLTAWNNHWHILDTHTYNLFVEKYGKDKVNALIESKRIEVQDTEE